MTSSRRTRSPGSEPRRGLAPKRRRTTAFLLAAIASVGCGGALFRYQQTAAPLGDLGATIAVRDETFVVQIRNGNPTPIFIDWSTARFVDVAGLERPLVLMSEGNVGTLASDVGSAVWDATSSGVSWVGARAEDGGEWVYDVASDGVDAARAWVEEDPCRAVKVAASTAVGTAFLFVVVNHSLPVLAARGVSGSAALTQALARFGQLKGAGGVPAGVGMVATSYHVFRDALGPVLSEVCHVVL